MTTFTPASIEEAQTWLQQRLEQPKPFQIRGNQTHFQAKAIPSSTESEDVLSLSKLTATNFFDPDDMVVGVEAGMSISKLQEILAEKKMVLPVNPWFGNSTLGGLLACNDIGPNRLMMGGLRDCIIGIEYINGRAERVHAGGKVVKNVTGYDLCRMMLGSLGGLGVITAANFKVIPQPVEPHGLYSRFQDTSWLLGAAALQEARLPIDWIQALAPATTGEPDWILGIGISGNPERQARLEKELQSLFQNQLKSIADGKTNRSLGYLPGTGRYTGWLEGLRKKWKLLPNHLHVMVLLNTRDALQPIRLEALQHNELYQVIHPIGADLHFLLDVEDPSEQLDFLQELKNRFRRTDAKMVFGSAHPDLSLQDLGEFGRSTAYSFTQRLQRHLDPAGVFHAPFYQLPQAMNAS
jgi:hypothetical protein